MKQDERPANEGDHMPPTARDHQHTNPDPQNRTLDWWLQNFNLAFGDALTLVRVLSPASNRIVSLLVRENTTGIQRVLRVFPWGARLDARVVGVLLGDDTDRFARILQHGRALGHEFIVREFVEVGSLRGIVPEGARAGDQALRGIARELITALTHAQALGIRHGNLHPNNVLVRSVFPLKLALADFTLTDAPAGEGEHEAFGSYTPPEGRDAGSNVDAWAFGVLLAELAGGKHPFASVNARMLQTSLVRVGGLVAGVGEPWFTLCVGLLRLSVGERLGLGDVLGVLDAGSQVSRVVPAVAPPSVTTPPVPASTAPSVTSPSVRETVEQVVFPWGNDAPAAQERTPAPEVDVTRAGDAVTRPAGATTEQPVPQPAPPGATGTATPPASPPERSAPPTTRTRDVAPILVETWSWHHDEDVIHLQGRIRNRGEATLKNVKVLIEMLDAPGGNIIEVDFCYAMIDELEPNDTSPFHNLTFTGRTVRHVDLSFTDASRKKLKAEYKQS